MNYSSVVLPSLLVVPLVSNTKAVLHLSEEKHTVMANYCCTNKRVRLPLPRFMVLHVQELSTGPTSDLTRLSQEEIMSLRLQLVAKIRE